MNNVARLLDWREEVCQSLEVVQGTKRAALLENSN